MNIIHLHVIRYSIPILLMGSFLACDTDDIWQAAISRGSVSDGVYHNKSLGFSTGVPEGWSLVSDSLLDVAVAYQEAHSTPSTPRSLYLFGYLNPATLSSYGMDCFPLFRVPHLSTLEDYAQSKVEQIERQLAAEGKSETSVEAEYLRIDEEPAVRISWNASTAGQTRVEVEYAQIKSLPGGGGDIVIRHGAYLHDSTDLRLVDSLVRTYRSYSLGDVIGM